MILEYELGQYRRIRLWLDELPDARFLPAETTRFEVPGATRTISPVQMAAVECWMATGPKDIHGLLGGEIHPAEDRSVEIGKTSLDGPPYEGSLDPFAGRNHNVRVGLPREYANAVEQGMRESMLRYPFAGRLTITCAAHCDVGSNEWLFRRLGRMLMYLLACDGEPNVSELSGLLTT